MLTRRTPLARKRKRERAFKPVRIEDPERLDRVRKLPCSVCGERFGIEAHHIRDGQVGAGQKAGDDEAIPLCVAHHRIGRLAFHYLGRQHWEAKFGSQREHLAKINRLLEDDDHAESIP